MSDMTLSTSVYHQSEDLVITNNDSATGTTTIDSFVSSSESQSVTPIVKLLYLCTVSCKPVVYGEVFVSLLLSRGFLLIKDLSF